MTTKPPAGINYYSDESFIKKLYASVDELKEIIPVDNDRYRLSFCLNSYFRSEIETLLDAIDQADPRSSADDYPVLEKKLVEIFNKNGIKKES
jgi:hypothetical protein